MKPRLDRRLASEDGAIAIIFAFMLVVFLGSAALVVDLGRQRHARQQLQDAVDSASIAGSDYLPASDSIVADNIKAMVTKIAVGSATGLDITKLNTTFLCVLRTPPNSVGGARPDLGNGAGSACGPASPGAWDSPVGWVAKGSRMTHACDPYNGDKCNAIKVQSSQTVKYLFAPAIGIGASHTTVNVQAVSCEGACKPTGSPLDVALVLDRTGSMTPLDITHLKDAAKELLKVYTPAQQRVGVLALPYPGLFDKCAVQSPQEYPDPVPDYAKWLVKGLSSDYNYANGNLTGDLVTKIDCLQRAASPTIKVGGNVSPSQSHTNLGDPMAAAADLLRQTGRPGVPHVIIFMTDGQANQPWDPARGFDHPCGYAANMAAGAKTQAEVYTVAYGVEDVRCPDTSGDYKNGGVKGSVASGLLADMATQPSVDDSRNTPGGCGPNENTDGDHYFCEDKTGDLSAVFRQIAIASIPHGRLIDVD